MLVAFLPLGAVAQDTATSRPAHGAQTSVTTQSSVTGAANGPATQPTSLPASRPSTLPAGGARVGIGPLRLTQDRTLPQRIDSAIERGVKYLLAAQNEDGSWTALPAVDRASEFADEFRSRHILNKPDPEGGRTALITLALLSSGQSPQSPAIRKAVDLPQPDSPTKPRISPW